MDANIRFNKDFIVWFLFQHGPSKLETVKKALYLHKKGTMEGYHSGWFTDYVTPPGHFKSYYMTQVGLWERTPDNRHVRLTQKGSLHVLKISCKMPQAEV